MNAEKETPSVLDEVKYKESQSRIEDKNDLIEEISSVDQFKTIVEAGSDNVKNPNEADSEVSVDNNHSNDLNVELCRVEKCSSEQKSANKVLEDNSLTSSHNISHSNFLDDNVEEKMTESQKNLEANNIEESEEIIEENSKVECDNVESEDPEVNSNNSNINSDNQERNLENERKIVDSNTEDVIIFDNSRQVNNSGISEDLKNVSASESNRDSFKREDTKSEESIMDNQLNDHELEKSKIVGEDAADGEIGGIPEERVKTEFVQITQDKQDDSQIESNSMDAEDPFGGDSLVAESMDIEEELKVKEGSPVQLSELTSELESVKEEENNTKKSQVEERENMSGSMSDSLDDEKKKKKTVENEPIIEIDKEEAKSPDNDKSRSADNEIDVNSEEKEKEKTAVSSIENESAAVLPGQDDQLCIIPDSMKDIEGEKRKDSNSKIFEMEKGIGERENYKETRGDNLKGIRVEATIDDKRKESPIIPRVELAEGTPQCITDVIDLEDESEKSTAAEIEEIPSTELCKQCNELKICKLSVRIGTEVFSVCSKACKTAFSLVNNKAMDIPSDGVNSKREKRCASCLLIVESGDERALSWETMEFCNEECLGKFQTKYGSYCRNCNGTVQAVSLGKYCVRFGYDVRQFCCSICLEEFKKGLKVCTYCQKDISAGTEGFLAPVGDKGQFKDFCTQDCMEKYAKMSSIEPLANEKKSCSVCQEEKIVHCEVQIDTAPPVAICSDPCFAAFKFVNKVDPDQCSTCKKFFELANKKSFIVFYENDARTFCSKTCLNIFIITNRKIVPCSWCKVKKYNFDMIKKELKTGQVMMMCSLNCLTLYQVSINAVSARRIKCDYCKEVSQAQYHLTMSDATIRNFCSYNCVMNFQGQYTKSPITIPSGDDHPVPTGAPKRTVPARAIAAATFKPTDIQAKKIMPVISSVTSLATMGNGQVTSSTQSNTVSNTIVPPPLAVHPVQTVPGQPSQIIYKQQVITRPPTPIKIHNKITQCKPLVHTKGVSVRPYPCTKSTQTDQVQTAIIPIPVPIYVPFPICMYNMPFPVPTPFPMPLPVPIFIPTTRNSAKGIMKDIKRIQEKIPSDPFEAELLMMAEMVATEKKDTAESDSPAESVDDNRDETGDEQINQLEDDNYCNETAVDSNNAFGDDMLQMALKMATGELEEPAVDLESALTPNTITPPQATSQTDNLSNIDNDERAPPTTTTTSTTTTTTSATMLRGRKRSVPQKFRSTPSKRGKRAANINEVQNMPPSNAQITQQRFNEPIEKPDANMALKYTFGVNAWRHWVINKNIELEKQNAANRKVKLFKTDLLQLTADELNYSLCLFLKEVRKPNGTEYAPDTIYYLCLGIQQYLFENNRIDNIFTDSYYEKFTDCLNEIAKKFSSIYSDAQYIVTRVEEEHLWECKQLGAHSPHVLLSTLMYFNTKHFNLVTVEEHMQLSFSHIMKHWKRNPAAPPSATIGKVPGSRNVLLRFYPPQSALDANSRKKKVYEQQENEENPLRCPVKLYEFYLSKCPESVKTRNDVFYLLPERSCVPDSPVWYSTSPIAKEQLVKMLYRIKMVKEINVALLNS